MYTCSAGFINPESVFNKSDADKLMYLFINPTYIVNFDTNSAS